MTAETIIPLKQLNVSEKVAELEALQAEADRYAKMGQPQLPGVPDIEEMIKQLIDDYVMAILEEVKQYIKEYLVYVMGILAVAVIPYVNKVIKVINKIIDTINRIIDTLMPIARAIFQIIIVVTIIYVVAKILTKIPSPGVGMGSVVVFDMFKAVALDIMNLCGRVLEKLVPIGFAIIAALLMLLSIFGFLNLLSGLLAFLAAMQNRGKQDAIDSSNKNADDWADSISDETGSDGSGLDGITDGSDILVECNLPDGTTKKMTAAECIAAGGTFDGLDSLLDYKQCLYLLQECKNNNFDNCNEIEKQCDDLFSHLDGLGNGDLGNLQLDDTIITTLLNLDDDVTIEKATENKGKRYGFYQSEKD